LLAAAECGARAVVAGPTDDIEAAEVAAIGHADDPPPGAEWTLVDYQRRRERHLAELPGLLTAGLIRPPSWSDTLAAPGPGCIWSCCQGARWWRERAEFSGWRCSTCHPFVYNLGRSSA
jgi:hypothetical protein